MCIIVCKPAGAALPGTSTLMACWDNNPDGAGLMYADGKNVHIAKGFMEWDDFADALNALGDVTAMSLVMHFRIATHGGVRPECCHPFPVSPQASQLGALEAVDRLGFAHNGVLRCARPRTKTESDTMAYIRDVVCPLRRMHEDLTHDGNAIDVLDATREGSRFALLDNSGDIVTLGDFVEVNGVLYSNDTYQSRPPRLWASYADIWDGLGEIEDDEDDPFGDDLDEDDILDMLPWDACAYCADAEECAYTYPSCASAGEARSMAARGVVAC